MTPRTPHIPNERQYEIEEQSGCINGGSVGTSRPVIFTCVAAEVEESSCAKQPCWAWRMA
jgi:hypothetical protein